jgi:tetratricopeptide (TPR) repeat protein
MQMRAFCAGVELASDVFARLVLAIVLLGWATTARAEQLDIQQAADAFQRTAIEPAFRAVSARDIARARLLVATVTSGLQELHPTVRLAQVTTLQRLARGYIDIALYDDALTLLDAAAAALTPAGPVGNPTLALILVDMARTHRLSGRPDTAAPLIARAQTLRPSAGFDPDAFPIQAELAELRRERRDLAGAETLLRPLIAAADRMSNWQSLPPLIPVFEAYAALLTDRGDAAAARAFTERAATIRRTMNEADEQMRRLLQRK